MAALLTRHAQIRKQQRGVPQLIIDWLIDYGAFEHDGHGATIHYFAKESLRRLRSEVGALVVNRLNDFKQAYLVMTLDGQIITVGYRR